MNKSAGAVVLALSLLVGVVPASAHPGGTDAAGCHAGSQPYHCHGAGDGSLGSGSEASPDDLTVEPEHEPERQPEPEPVTPAPTAGDVTTISVATGERFSTDISFNGEVCPAAWPRPDPPLRRLLRR